MEYKNKLILVEKPRKNVALITLNNPPLNLVTLDLSAELRETLFKAQRYAKEIEEAEKDAAKTRPFDMKLEALLPVLRKEIPLKAHAHRADDILTAIRIAKEFDVDITLDHVTEGHLIVRHLVKAGKPVLVGPSFGSKSKQELREKSFATAGILDDAGLEVCIITDAPVIPLYYLPLCAGLAVKRGARSPSIRRMSWGSTGASARLRPARTRISRSLRATRCATFSAARRLSL